MGIIDETNCRGCLATLVVNSVPLQTAGWCFPYLEELLSDPDYKGEDRPINGADDLPFPRDDDRLEVVLTGWIAGDYAGETGAALTTMSLTAGVLRNFTYLQSHVSAPVTSGTGTVVARLTPAYGAVRVADVHAGPLKMGRGAIEGLVPATLLIEVPAGRFA